MLIVNLTVFMIVTLLAFIAAWRLVPSGWLTAVTGTFGAVVIALHEAMTGMMPELKTLLPAEYRPWLVIVFLLLTVAARFRNRPVET